jgi:ribosomal protein S18 acetylase RimI-like enzyme
MVIETFDQLIFREANPNDNEGLLKLTRECPMDGEISLIIDRQPDFFKLLKLKGVFKTFVAEDSDQLIGSISIVSEEVRIRGEKSTIGYLSDLKIHPRFRGSPVAYRLMFMVNKYREERQINTCLMLAAENNDKVKELFQGRLGIEKAYQVAEFSIFQFIPKPVSPSTALSIVPFDPFYRDQIIKLLNEYYSSFQFSTIVNERYEFDQTPCWMVINQAKVTAVIGIIDTFQLKQNIVLKIPLRYKIILRIVGIIWPNLRLPKEGVPIRLLEIKYLAYLPAYKDHTIALIQHVRRYAYDHKYSLVSYGIDSRNSLCRSLRLLTKIVFHSVGFVMEFNKTKGSIQFDQICHYDFYKV